MRVPDGYFVDLHSLITKTLPENCSYIKNLIDYVYFLGAIQLKYRTINSGIQITIDLAVNIAVIIGIIKINKSIHQYFLK